MVKILPGYACPKYFDIIFDIRNEKIKNQGKQEVFLRNTCCFPRNPELFLTTNLSF
jgi:hypothetical protein